MPLPSAKNRAAAATCAQFSVISARVTVTAPVSTRAAQRSDSSRKSAGSNIASAIPTRSACGPDSIRFWLRAFSMITFSSPAGPMRRGSS